jgi:hypothetical protein
MDKIMTKATTDAWHFSTSITQCLVGWLRFSALRPSKYFSVPFCLRERSRGSSGVTKSHRSSDWKENVTIPVSQTLIGD